MCGDCVEVPGVGVKEYCDCVEVCGEWVELCGDCVKCVEIVWKCVEIV